MLLAFDTATTTASIALYDPAQGLLLAEMTWQARRRHTQEVLPTAQALLRQMDITPAQIHALAVTTGPGSFTGVRIAISVVKGMALGLAQPPQVVGIPTLTVTAWPWLAPAHRSGAAVWALIQAGRGRYNWVVWRDAHTPLLPAAADHRVGTARDLVAALAAETTQPIWLVGEVGMDLTAAAGLAHVTVVDEVAGARRSGVLARLAAQALGRGETVDPLLLQPLYLQEP